MPGLVSLVSQWSVLLRGEGFLVYCTYVKVHCSVGNRAKFDKR